MKQQPYGNCLIQTGFSRVWRFSLLLIWLSMTVSQGWAFVDAGVDASKFPVEVYGDYLEYRHKANQVVVKGKAFITYKDMRIAGDTIQSNTKSEDIFAQGNVDFWKGYDQTKGDFLVYNMKSGKGWMREASIRRNRNFFRAKEVYVSPTYSLAKEIMNTTCDHEDHPHYRLMAERFEVIPGKESTIENLAFRWRGRTLYHKSLEHSVEKEKSQKFFSTRQGVSQIDGFYLKFMTDMDFGPNMQGKFVYDHFEKRGYGFGFNGAFTQKENSNGTFSFYNLQETMRNHSNVQMNLSHNYRFKRGDSLSTNLSYTGDKSGGYSENQDLNTQLNYSGQLSFATVNAIFSKFYDIDGDKYEFDNGYQILDRLPEVNFSFPAYTLPGVPITMNLSGMFAKYQEGTPDDRRNTEKKDIRSSFTTPTIQVNERFDLTPSYNFEKSWYSGGIIRETGTTNVRASHKFTSMTNMEFNYNITTQKGESPFRFDSQTTVDLFSTRLRIATQTWSFNPINFNYNRVAKRLEQVYWDYSLRSSPDAYHNWEFFLRRDYTPDPVALSKMAFTRLTPGNLNIRYRLSSQLWSFDTSVTYPHEYRRITNTSFNYRATIRPLWQVSSNGNFNHLTGKFSPLTLGIIRDLHCWETRAEYNLERKEFWIEFYLKAFPSDAGRFRYGADTNRLEAKLATFDQLTQQYDSFRGPGGVR
ncbi:MAG TPA: hypothetical protein PKO06_01350 [Candidatus Ozemobacteraceae bacterium]|nr:hypothetical protein [Candidatus Ozemobacteraceae bacterium]